MGLSDTLRSRGVKASPVGTSATIPRATSKPVEAAAGGAPIFYMDLVQGTTAWMEARSGIPTASCFDKIVTPKGAKSKSRQSYMYRLLAERIMGHPVEDKPFSRWMDRGSEMEASAVAYYEFQRDLETVKVGFVTNAAKTIGASPDRLVGEPGLLEVKVPAEHTHVGYLLAEGSEYDEYRIQVQGQLWVTQKDWSDMLSFHPEMPYALYRTERDEAFIEILANEVGAFALELEALFLKCVERGWVQDRKPNALAQPKREPLPPLADLVKAALRDVAEAKR